MKFSSVIGQQETKNRLIQTVTDQRISHALLFTGPRGSGKLTLAIAYAQYLNCRSKISNDSCGICPSCIKYEKLIHPDLHFIFPVSTSKEVDKKPTSLSYIASWRELVLERKAYFDFYDWIGHIGVEKKQAIINADDCNEIIRTLGYKSFEAEYKVMIIWMAEKLYHSAAPKLLKILEEPPEKTLFILVSEEPDQIISTILSRCQIVKVPAITTEDLVSFLQQEFIIGKEEAERTAFLSGGNVNRAIKSLNQGEDDLFFVRSFIRWMRLCMENKASSIIAFTGELARLGREKQKDFLVFSLGIIREFMLMNQGCDNISRLVLDDAKFMNFKAFMDPQTCLEISEELNLSAYCIERNVNPGITFLDLSLKISDTLIRKKNQKSNK